MEKIINNPGFQNLTDNVFLNLDVDVLKICGQINKSCEQILKKPMFWLRKFRCLSKESQKDWVNIIQSVKNSDYEIVIICYLQWKLKKEVVEVVDLPYIWFKKFRSLLEENQNNWIKIIESHKNSDKEESIMYYIQWKLEEKAFLHYYASFEQFMVLQKLSKLWPLGPNAPNENGVGDTPTNL